MPWVLHFNGSDLHPQIQRTLQFTGIDQLTLRLAFHSSTLNSQLNSTMELINNNNDLDTIDALFMEEEEAFEMFFDTNLDNLTVDPLMLEMPKAYDPLMPVDMNNLMMEPLMTMVPTTVEKPQKRRTTNTFVNKEGRVIRGKPCSFLGGCYNRAQSGGLCKAHGGGARCVIDGCTRSSQGNGKCRSHGGGKRCKVEGCVKGCQRGGYCYFHRNTDNNNNQQEE